VGQVREVTVHRLLAEATIEEGIYACAQDKLKLEQDLAAASGETESSSTSTRTKKDLKKLLKLALNVDMSERSLGDVKKVFDDGD